MLLSSQKRKGKNVSNERENYRQNTKFGTFFNLSKYNVNFSLLFIKYIDHSRYIHFHAEFLDKQVDRKRLPDPRG